MAGLFGGATESADVRSKLESTDSFACARCPIPGHEGHALDWMNGADNEAADNWATGSGASIHMPHAYCRRVQRRLKIPFLTRVRVALEQAGLPSDSEVLVRQRASAETELPPGMMTLDSEPERELILPEKTQESLERLRRRISFAAEAFERHGLNRVTSLRLHALFYGPPGTGKTSGFRFVTEKLATERYVISLRSLVGSHLGDTEKNLQNLTEFVHARSGMPGHLALLIDDADDFCGARGDDNSAAGQTLNGLKVGLLRLLDTAQQVPIFLTTNRVRSLDKAIHRRIVEHVAFPLPDEDTRVKVLTSFLSRLKDLDEGLSTDSIRIVARDTEGFSHAELAQVVVDGVCERASGGGLLRGMLNSAQSRLTAGRLDAKSNVAEPRHSWTSRFRRGSQKP